MVNTLLTKDAALFQRDETGSLVPTEVELVVDTADEMQKQLEGKTVSITPLPRGELRRLFAMKPTEDGDDTGKDNEIILKHCISPEFTKEDVKFLKPAESTAIVNTILFHSGLDVLKFTRKKALKKTEDEFAKN